MHLQGSGSAGKTASRKNRDVIVAMVDVTNRQNSFMKTRLARKCDKYHVLPAWLRKTPGSGRAEH